MLKSFAFHDIFSSLWNFISREVRPRTLCYYNFMTRGAKKFVYGVFYLFIFGVFLYWIFGGSGTTVSQNNLSIPEGSVTPIAVTGPIQIFKNGDLSRIALLAEISNKNAEYGAETLDYVFSLFDKNGALVDKIRGSDMIFPEESKFLFASYEGTSYNIGRASRASLDLSPQWVLGSELIRPYLSLDGSPITAVTSDGIRVEGSVKNTSPLATGKVRVIVLLYNKYGDPLFGGQTLLERIGSLRTAPFSVYFPPDPSILGAIDSSKTKALVSLGD